jgi:hypothetical protein
MPRPSHPLNFITLILYKCYVSGHYPSSSVYLKTPSSLLFQDTAFRRLDSVSIRW